ncbi:phosphoadenylyl-sulfate reductase [Flavobacteriales bacterium]|nr:phosphoadenylyl-sulfate reductase [Flavobacteriales bacterium]
MLNVKTYINRYQALSIYQRMEQLYSDFDADDIMLTSAFSAYSALLLKFISEVNKSQVIYFIDTGYHFQETLDYKEYLSKRYQLNVVSVSATNAKQLKCQEQELCLHQPNRCCLINRIQPLEEIKEGYNIWVSGVMQWQTTNRSKLSIFEKTPNILKFHPLIDMNEQACNDFILKHDLPSHPLKEKGYDSIGCTPCTKAGNNRAGRWQESDKTECGLHL